MRIKITISFICALSALAVHAQPIPKQNSALLWDGFVVINGEINREGMVRGCILPDTMLIESGKSSKCRRVGLLQSVLIGEPHQISKNEAVEMVLRAEGRLQEGEHASFVGALPHYQRSTGRGGGTYSISANSFVALYRLTTPSGR